MADEPTVVVPLTRDDIRSKIFGNQEFKREHVTFFGQKLELRQTTLKAILDVKEDGIQAAVIRTLVNQAYIPGTDTKVFEDGDAEALLNMPFGPDFAEVSNALEKLTNVNFTKRDKG